jgi:type III restriction enzyme
MSLSFFDRPILNSPYDYPARYWELDESGQPTNRVIERRRPAQYVSLIPKPKKQRLGQADLALSDATGSRRSARSTTPAPGELHNCEKFSYPSRP